MARKAKKEECYVIDEMGQEERRDLIGRMSHEQLHETIDELGGRIEYVFRQKHPYASDHEIELLMDAFTNNRVPMEGLLVPKDSRKEHLPQPPDCPGACSEREGSAISDKADEEGDADGKNNARSRSRKGKTQDADVESKLNDLNRKIRELKDNIDDLNRQNYELRVENSNLKKDVKSYEKEDYPRRMAELEAKVSVAEKKSRDDSSALMEERVRNANLASEIESRNAEIEALKDELAHADKAGGPDAAEIAEQPVFEKGMMIRASPSVIRSEMFTFSRYEVRLAVDGSFMTFRENVSGKCTCNDGEIKIPALDVHIPFTGTTTYEAFRGPGSVITVKLR